MGMPFGSSSSTSPASSPDFSLSITERISYFSEWRTRPLAVLPSHGAEVRFAVDDGGRAGERVVADSMAGTEGMTLLGED